MRSSAEQQVKESTMTIEQKVMYTGKTHTTGGRAGTSRSDDGRLDIRLSIPGASGNGTNPEQLFAAGLSTQQGNPYSLANV